MKPNKLITITGNIGSGKSTACDFFTEHGYQIISADRLSHEIMEDPEIIKSLCESFGKEILENNRINRRILGRIVFTSDSGTKILNEIMHPVILSELVKKMNQKPERTIFEIPLLFETGQHENFEIIILITAYKKIRKKRIMKRAGMTSTKADSMIASQMPEEEKKKLADYVISNNENMEKFRRKLTDLMELIENETGVMKK